MKLFSEVVPDDYPFRLDHREKILMSGSCFTENIGRMLERYRFPVNINPFGTVFNPLSVKSGLLALMNKEEYVAGDLDQHRDQWFSFDHYTGFSSRDRETCLEKINAHFRIAKHFLAECHLLLLTWGTAWIYTLKEDGRVVSNCHRIPSARFERSRLRPEEILREYRSFLPELFAARPGLKILLTISPVRHLKDGAHGNQLSKASLLLAAAQLVEEFPDRVFYFPSYEIVMDELRDYRYYGEDLVHTNELATKYIWEKFQHALLSEQSLRVIRDLEPYLKLREHRPSDNSPESRQQLDKQLLMKAAELLEKYPFIDL